MDENEKALQQEAKKILLVEDSDADILLIKKAINDHYADVTIETVKSIGDAYGKTKSGNYDLIILDLNLPDGFGPSSVSEIRRFNKSDPIIVLTGIGTDITIKSALKNGANHFALKSQIMTGEFIELLKNYLKK